MSVSSSSATTQALLKVLQIPRQDYRSCPAVFHHVGSEPDLDMIDQVDKLIVRVWRATAIAFISLNILVILGTCLGPASRFPNLNPQNRSKFINSFKDSLSKSATFEIAGTMCLTIMYFFSTVITPIKCRGEKHERAKVCICSLSRGESALEELAINSETKKPSIDVIKNHLQKMHGDGVEAGRVSVTEIGEEDAFNARLEVLAEEIYHLVEHHFSTRPDHPVLRYIELMALFGGVRIISFMNFYVPSLENDSDDRISSQLVFTLINSYIRTMEREGKVITHESLEELKLEADVFAAAKNYTKAIELYSIVGELAPNVNAKVNCAALRLRIAKDIDTHQFQLVIMDCTFALELEPNHVKALFRRGLAFCKLKMWNEGIVDFERAIELDSRSPAVQELTVARRQVMRRLGA